MNEADLLLPLHIYCALWTLLNAGTQKRILSPGATRKKQALAILQVFLLTHITFLPCHGNFSWHAHVLSQQVCHGLLHFPPTIFFFVNSALIYEAGSLLADFRYRLSPSAGSSPYIFRSMKPGQCNLGIAARECSCAEAMNASRSSLSLPLEDIEEDAPMSLPLALPSHLPPETPQEPMEFLSRSWSISALEVAKALNPIDAHQKSLESGGEITSTGEKSILTTAPFSFASAMTAQIVLDKIMAQSDVSPFTSRRNSYSNGPLNFSGSSFSGGSPPMSPRQADDLSTWLLLHQSMNSDNGSVDCLYSNKFYRSFSAAKPPLRGISLKKWMKDMRERKKEALRVHNSQVHAAMSVAGVAAALAAIAASTAANTGEESQNRTSMAVASAATLVAAQCVEAAESMGASREQISSVVSSAVSVKTPGDVMTLTAAAATALRAAETLKARASRNSISHSAIIPYERGGSNNSNSSGDLASDHGDSESCTQDFLRRGCEFLKRTRKGELHWRVLFVYMDKNSQVVVKSQSKYMGGTITKSKKRMVQDVISEIPAWPGRGTSDGIDQRRYFGIKTDHGVMELECRNETDHRLWTEGISRLLSRAQHRRLPPCATQP